MEGTVHETRQLPLASGGGTHDDFNVFLLIYACHGAVSPSHLYADLGNKLPSTKN